MSFNQKNSTANKSLPKSSSTALKEWAVVVKALSEGNQILLLRKGGISEEGKEFKVQYPEFFLYPTFEHQKSELLKTQYHTDLSLTLEGNKDLNTVTLSHWAQVTEVIEMSEQKKVDALSPNYIWTTDYAEKRLHWKPSKPLLIMLIRVHRLVVPKTLPILERYSGCKSWVDLERGVPLCETEPVLTDEEYDGHIRQIDRALQRD